MDSVSNVFFSNKQRFVNENPDIAGYSMLIQLIRVSEIVPNLNKKQLLQIAESFQKVFPDHPYSEYIEADEKIKIGNTCPDFIAPDRDGRNIRLSDMIASKKVILIDLWAPWCGPCIQKGRDIIPTYLKYKDSGFEILGVVGGIKDVESYNKAIDKEKYPWLNLYDIKNDRKIWEKFNIMNSGGATFLIDKDRVILAINPTNEDVEKIIKEII
jgi:peroxiredoxin